MHNIRCAAPTMAALLSVPEFTEVKPIPEVLEKTGGAADRSEEAHV